MATVKNIIARITTKDETGPGSESAAKNTGRVTEALDKAKVAAAGMALAAGAAFIKIAESAFETVSDVEDLSNSLGVAIEDASDLIFAGAQAGYAVEDIRSLFQRLNEIVQIDAAESADTRNLLKLLGIDAESEALKSATAAELGIIFSEAIKRLGPQGAAIAEAIGITGEDLTVLLKVSAQLVDGVTGEPITLDDIIRKQEVDELYAKAKRVGEDFALTLAEGLDNVFTEEGGARNFLGGIAKLTTGTDFGLIQANAKAFALAYVGEFGEQFELTTAAQQEDFFNRVLPFFEGLGDDLGEAAGDAATLSFFKLLGDVQDNPAAKTASERAIKILEEQGTNAAKAYLDAAAAVFNAPEGTSFDELALNRAGIDSPTFAYSGPGTNEQATNTVDRLYGDTIGNTSTVQVREFNDKLAEALDRINGTQLETNKLLTIANESRSSAPAGGAILYPEGN